MRSLKKILPVALLALIVVMVPLHFSQAQAGLLFGLASDSLETGLAWLMNNVVLAVMSVFLAIAGWLLNVSMNLTLSIKEFVDSTPAIYMTWKTIRDIAGMFMIFFLLWASFQMILGRSSKFGQLIKSILVAGVLINFSFFIAGLGIDVSNIVSVQLYNAIAPANSLNGPQSEQALRDGSWRSRMDGGLSDIVMSGLRIQTISDRIKFAKNEAAGAGAAASSGITGPIKVILTGAIAAVIEFMAAMSFGAAAIAFIIRFVILIFLLAFSPLWYATWMIPQLKEYSSKWSKNYMAMLLFMPVYLLLMYLALNVLSTSPIFDVSASAAATGNWWKDFVVLGVNATLVIVLLNIPLLAAASMANGTIGILQGAREKWSGGKIFSKFGSQVGSQIGSRTIGRAAYSLANSNFMAGQLAKSSPLVSSALQKSLGSVVKSGFGAKKGSYEDRLKTKKEAEKQVHKAIGTFDKSKYDNTDATKVDRGIINEKGEKETKKMNERQYEEYKRKQLQAKFRENLPWKPGVVNWGLPGTSGIIGFMVDNRANRQAKEELSKVSKRDKKKSDKTEAEKTRDDKQKEMDRLDLQINNLKRKKEDPRLALAEKIDVDREIEEREEKKEKIKEEIIELDKTIREGKEAEAEEKEEKAEAKKDEAKEKKEGDDKK